MEKIKKEEMSLMNLLGGKIQFKDVEEILNRTVKRFGAGSAHIIVPKKHIDKQAQITFFKKQEAKKK